MPVTVIATPLAVDANSYITTAEGDAYHEAHLYPAAWVSASTDQKNRAVVMATRLLDAMFEWSGTKATEAQALQWPMSGMFDPAGYPIEAHVIPRQLKDATAELARTLLAGDRTADNAAEAQGLKSLKAGPVELTFAEQITPKVISDAVYHLLPRAWGRLRSRVNSGTTVMLERA
jgi:hypothetical protein